MNKVLLRCGIALTAISLFFACTKDVEVLDVFDFDFFIKSEPKGFVFEINDVDVSVIPDRKVDGVVYNMTYDILEGDGYFENLDGNLLKEGEKFTVEEFKKELKWIPQNIGAQIITLKLFDSNGNEHTKEINFLSQRAPFTYVANLTTETYPINEKTPIKLTLVRKAKDEFDFTFLITDADGEFYLPESDTKIGDTLVINSGSTELLYKPKTLGNHKITTTVIAPDFATRSKILNINSVHIPFDFRITPSAQEAAVGFELPINVSLSSKEIEKELDYTVSFQYAEGSVNGTLKNEKGNEVNPGTEFKIIPDSYEYTFSTVNNGTAELEFTLKDSNDQTKVVTTDIDFSNIPFTFTGSALENQIPLNTTVPINFTLTPLSKNSKVSYTIMYTNSSGSGVLVDEEGVNTVLEPGVLKEVEPGNFSLTYTPNTLGEHNLVFEVTDNLGEKRNLELELEAINFPINFNVSADSEVFLNEPFDINFDVSPLGVIQDFEYGIKYSLLGGTGSFENELDNAEVGFKPALQNSFSDTFTPEQPGVYEFEFTIKDNNDQLISENLSVVVKNNDFDFNAVPSNNRIIVGEEANINFNILPNRVDSRITYDFSFEFNGPIFELKDGVFPIPVGADKTVNPGNLSFILKPLEVGSSEIIFKIKDSNGNIHEDSINIEFINQEFSFSASFSNQILVNQINQFNYSLTPNNLDSNLDYEFSYIIEEGTGFLQDRSNTLNQGDFIQVRPTNFSFNYTPTSIGNHSIKYSIKDSNGFIKEFTQNFTANAIDYDFSVSQTKRDIIVNADDKITLNIDQEFSSDLVYKLNYTIVGVGNLFSRNGNPIQNGSDLGDGITELFFKSNKSGASEIAFTITDENGISKSSTVQYNISNIDFDINATGGSNLFVNTSKAFNLFVTQKGNENSVGYKVSYIIDSSSTGSGSLKSSTGAVINLATDIDISTGTTEVFFEGTSVGLVVLKAIITSNNGITKEVPITFNVENVNYNITAAAQTSTIVIGESTNINFNLSEVTDSGTQYEISYLINSGNGLLKRASENLINNRFYPIPIGVSSLNFTANTVGQVEYEFTVKNKSTLIEKKVISRINVLELPTNDFSFEAIATDNRAIVNGEVPINLNIVETTGNSNYQLVFTNSKRGTFNYNNREYSQGELININAGNTTGIFKGLEAGNHQINFEVSNANTTPIKRLKTVSLDYSNIGFNVVASGTGNLFLNNEKEFNLFLSQEINDPSISYKVRFLSESSSTGTGNVFINGNIILAGDLIDLSLNSNPFNFKAVSIGSVVKKAEIIDSNGVVKEVFLRFNVQNINYNFSTAPQTRQLDIGETTNLNLNISESSPSGTTYQVKYVTNTGSGIIRNGTTELLTNVFYPVSVGSSVWSFEGTTAGVSEYTFTSRNTSTNVEITSDLSILTENPPTPTYTFSATATENTAIVDEDVTININIREENGNSNYQLTFNSSKSSSVDYLGTTYRAGQPINVTSGFSSLRFKGLESGPHDISLDVVNSVNVGRNATVSIDYENIDFTAASSGDGNVLLNNEREFNLFLSQSIEDPSISYEVMFTIEPGSSGLGEIADSANNSHNLSTKYPINIGTNKYFFKGINLGTVNLKAQITDSNGIIKSSIINFNVNNINYNFSVASQKRTVTIGEDTNMNFNISESIQSSTLYDIKYNVIRGDALIKNGSINLNTNTLYPISIGNSSWDFTPSIIGDLEIEFIVINRSTKVEKTGTVIVEVIEKPESTFTFTAIPSRNRGVVNDGIPVNLNIVESNGSSTYQLVYVSDKNSEVIYNGLNYTQGEVIPVTSGASSLIYIGKEGGLNNITFTTTNSNTTPLAINDDINITYENIDFNVSASGDGDVFVNENKTLNLFISQQVSDPSISYQVRYSIASGSIGAGTLEVNGNPIIFGSLSPISLGTTEIDFTGTILGIINLKIEVIDSNNISHEDIVRLNVENIDFDFSAVAQSSTLTLGEQTNINFNINESADSGTQYEFKYKLNSGRGDVVVGSTSRNVNVWYPLSLGASSWSFISTNAENIEIEFTARNKSTRVEKTAVVSIVVEDLPDSSFTFTAIPSRNKETVREIVPINFNISESNGTSTYTAILSTSETGSFNFNGTDYASGESIPISSGSFSINYTGENVGAHDIDIRISNSNSTPLILNKNISIDFESIDFNLSTAGDGDVFINNEKDFNIFLTQSQPDPSITYEVRYSILGSSSGNLEIFEGSVQRNFGTLYPITVGNTIPKIKGTSIGEVTVLVEVIDNNGVKKESNIVFEVKNVEFNFTAASQSNTINLNNSTNINFNLTETIDSNTPYEMKYIISRNDGEIMNGTNTLNSNVFYNVNTGFYNWQFTGSTEGDTDIMFTLRNKITGEEKSEIVSIAVVVNDFEFTVTPTKTDLFVNDLADLNFNITGSNPSTVYKVRYAYNTNFAEIKDSSDSILVSGLLYDNTGSFTWKLRALNRGNLAITFFVSDPTTGVEKTSTISLAVTEPDYIFIATREKSEAAVKEEVRVTLNITEISGSGDTYRAFYSSSSNATVTYDGVEYLPGQIFNLTGLSSVFTYKGEIPGVHDVEFVVISDSVNKQKQDDVSIEFIPIDFDLSVSATNSSTDPRPDGNLVNDIVYLDHTITETGGTGTYKILYNISGVSNEIFLTDSAETVLMPGVQYPVTSNSFRWGFRGDNVGTTTINYRLEDAFGNVFQVSEDIKVSNETFDFVITPIGTDQIRQELYDFNIELTKNPPGLTYELKTINTINSSVIQYKGVDRPNGSSFNYDPSDKRFKVYSNDLGVVSYTIEITASNGEVVSKQINFDFKNRSFDFTVTRVGSSAFINQDTLFRVNLSNAPSNLSYTLSVDAPNTTLNHVRFNNVNRGERVAFNIPRANNSVFINTRSEGNNNLIFRVVASNGVVVNKTLSANFQKTINLTRAVASTGRASNGCRPRVSKAFINLVVSFTKSNSARLSLIRINNITTGQNFSVNTSANINDNQFTIQSESDCGNANIITNDDWFRRGHRIRISLTDSNGNTSNTSSISVQ